MLIYIWMIVIQNWTSIQDCKLHWQCCGEIWESPAREVPFAMFSSWMKAIGSLYGCTEVAVMWWYAEVQLPLTYHLMAVDSYTFAGVWEMSTRNKGFRCA